MENVRHITPRHGDEGDGGFERVPPQDLDAEQSVLGAMLTSRQVIADVTATMEPTDHYRPAHETIHRAILTLHEAGEPADPITVSALLTKTGQISRVGGSPYIHQLVNAVPVAANAEHYAEIVHDMARRRRLVEVGTRLAAAAYQGDGDVDDIIEGARKDFDTAAVTTARGPGHLLESVLDWDTFYATDFGNVQLLPGRLMAPGQQITIIGDGKAGKSLFALEWLWRMATGQSFLGDRPADPVPVLYADAENGQEQIQERLFSYGAGPGRMGLLTYSSFPTVRPLDTAGGGADLMALVRASSARVVAIDTVSRFISGPENDADTWLSLYRHTLLPLKREGISSIRLDHFGKDKDRGGRGSSAKTQDVDHVWELDAQGGGMLALKRTHTRTGVGPGFFAIRRESRQDGDFWVPGATRHILYVPDDSGFGDASGLASIPGTVEHIMATLDDAGMPNDTGNRVARQRLAELKVPGGSDKIAEAVRRRKARSDTPGFDVSGERSGDRSGGRFPETFPGTHPRNGETAGQTFPGTPPETSGTPPVPHPSPSEGGGVEERTEQAQAEAPPKSPKCVICLQPLDADRANAGYDTHHPCPTT